MGKCFAMGSQNGDYHSPKVWQPPSLSFDCGYSAGASTFRSKPS